jgi:uncharacterized SAM-dependent methyltransferase
VKHFKNTELAKIYNISEKSVRNWIQAAQDKKLSLELFEKNGKAFIADTSQNRVLIEELVQKGKKYKNTRGFKTVQPTARFYELFTSQQVFDIVTNIDTYREIPRQYNYFENGAEYWDKYTHRLASEDTSNVLTSTIKLLNINQQYLDEILGRFRRVNIVDIGVGNALPVKDLLAHLLEQQKLGRYIAIDISAEMLKIAKKNIEQWFGDTVSFEGHELDINYDRFTHVLMNEYFGEDANDTINLVLVLGGTLGNLRSPDGAFTVIHDSINRNDLFLQTFKLDTETTRRYFDFNIDAKTQPLAPQYKFIVDLLNIDESFYDVEMGYREDTHERFLQIRLKVAISITFTLDEDKRVLELNKDDTILMWRYRHQTPDDIAEQLQRNNFYPLQSSQTEDANYLLTISRVNRK